MSDRPQKRDDEPPESAPADPLSRHGGEGLVTFGVALVVLACVFADEATVAPIFAFGGVASIVLGVILVRVEGDLEFTTTGLRTRLLAVRTIASREDLTLEEKADEIIEVVESSWTSPLKVPHRGAAAGWPDPLSAAQRGWVFEAGVRDRLRADGWDVHEEAGDHGGDLVAQRSDEQPLVVVKATRRLSRADVERAIAGRLLAERSRARRVLATPAGAVSAEARAWLHRTHPSVEILEVA